MVGQRRDLAWGAGAVFILLVVLSGPILATLDKARKDAKEHSVQTAADHRDAGRQFSLLSETDQEASLDAGAREDRERSDLDARWATARWTFAQFVTAALGAAVLVFAVLFAYRAWQAAKRSAVAATDANWSFIKASRLNLRAHVSAENIRVEQFATGFRPRFAFDIVNRGATPARDLEVWSAAVERVGNPNAKRVRKLAKPTGSKFALAPHQDISQSGDMLVAIEGSDLAALHAGRWTVVFFGIIRYRDVYGVRRWTMFKTYVSSVALKDGAARLGACRRNNHST